MGTFNSLIDAKFSPPRNWILDTPLKFNSEELRDEGQKLFKKCGVNITKANVITAPKGYIQTLLPFHVFAGDLLLRLILLEQQSYMMCYMKK